MDENGGRDTRADGARDAGRRFDLADNHGWIGFMAALVGAAICVAALMVAGSAFRRRRYSL